ncbi:hypothetical protein EYZ11_006863 [Aspergillus tanneri]|nr:hypothetical protein EYZ11_006863 [Aspergillus tanneri]
MGTKMRTKDAPTGSIIPYTFKSHADDFVQLAKQLNCENIIVGGHDWGAVIAYRCALYYPDFITHLFTFVIPYIAPSFKWVETDVLVNRFPSLGYQLQFGSDDGVIESFTREKAGIRAFLNALYGGTSPAGKYAMDVTKGVDLELAPKLQHTRLVSPEELDFYVEEFARNGLPCNYYRNRKQNFEDELVFKDKPDAAFITCPTLFIRSVDDAIVTSVMVASMGTMVPNLTLKDVKAGHWILWQKPVEVNDILTGWMRQQGLVAEDTFGHL